MTRSCSGAAGTGGTAATAGTTRPGPAASAAGRTTTAGSLGPPASPATATPQVRGVLLGTGKVWEGRVWSGMSRRACPSGVVPPGLGRLSSGMGWDSGKAQVGVYAPRSQCGHHSPSARCPAGICAASRSYKADSPHPHHPRGLIHPTQGRLLTIACVTEPGLRNKVPLSPPWVSPDLGIAQAGRVPAGSLHPQCDSSGTCTCKANVTGWKCERCRDGYHSLSQGGCR